MKKDIEKIIFDCFSNNKLKKHNDLKVDKQKHFRYKSNINLAVIPLIFVMIMILSNPFNLLKDSSESQNYITEAQWIEIRDDNFGEDYIFTENDDNYFLNDFSIEYSTSSDSVILDYYIDYLVENEEFYTDFLEIDIDEYVIWANENKYF